MDCTKTYARSDSPQRAFRNTIVGLIMTTLTFVFFQPAVMAQPHHAGNKKVILFTATGTNADVHITDVVSRISRLDELPIDGIAIRPLKKSLRNGFTPVFDKRAWSESDFELATMAQVKWGRVKDNFFLTFTQADYTMDWWDDNWWKTITANMRLLSGAMQTAGIRSIIFDNEFYGEWNTPAVFDVGSYPGRDRDQLVAKVKQRGSEFMTALQSEVKDVQIVAMFCNYNLSGWYGLVAPFAEGCLGVAEGDAAFVDGNEYMYYKFETRHYFTDYASRNNVGPRKNYPSSFQLGLPLYWNPMSQDNGFSDQVKKDWYEHTYYFTTLASDQYVWIFAEQVNWLTGDMDKNTFDAFWSARNKLARGEALGFNQNKKTGTDWNYWEGGWQKIASPALRLSSPSNNAIIASGQPIKLTAEITLGTERQVVFYVNSMQAATISTAPFSHTLTGLKDGAYTVFAMAYGTDDTHNTSNPVTFTISGTTPARHPFKHATGRSVLDPEASRSGNADVIGLDGRILGTQATVGVYFSSDGKRISTMLGFKPR